jgi:cytolysin-activating lysine-acyltransferase
LGPLDKGGAELREAKDFWRIDGAHVTEPSFSKPTPEAIKLALEQAKSVLKKLPLLGPIAWLFMNSPQHRNQFIADLEWRVMPPLVLEQAKLYMRDEAPVAYASWAFLSPEVAERYRSTGRLAPGDWKSGAEAWLIDLVAPFGGADDVIKDIKTNVLKGGELRVRDGSEVL